MQKREGVLTSGNELYNSSLGFTRLQQRKAAPAATKEMIENLPENNHIYYFLTFYLLLLIDKPHKHTGDTSVYKPWICVHFSHFNTEKKISKDSSGAQTEFSFCHHTGIIIHLSFKPVWFRFIPVFTRIFLLQYFTKTPVFFCNHILFKKAEILNFSSTGNLISRHFNFSSGTLVSALPPMTRTIYSWYMIKKNNWCLLATSLVDVMNSTLNFSLVWYASVLFPFNLMCPVFISFWS